MKSISTKSFRAAYALVIALFLIIAFSNAVLAHPLGNFTVNHFSRLQIGSDKIALRYIIDMAEIPAFQTLQALDANHDGQQSDEELKAFAEQNAARYAEGLLISVDNSKVKLQAIASQITKPVGTGGLPTLRLEYEFVGSLQASTSQRRAQFEDSNDKERIGWHEIIIAPNSGISVFDCNVFANSITEELQAYPEDMLAAPLNERKAEFSFSTGAMPANAKALLTREGRAVSQTRDRFAELINVPELTISVALLGLLIAAFLGGVHAMSPGHGKTVVGAYLVGSRGTPKHAAFLGLTVTITHTLGVFALGLVTLFASKYIVPEKLFPVISLLSGLIVFGLGLSLFIKRIRSAFGLTPSPVHHAHDHHAHDDTHEHSHAHDDTHDHHHAHDDAHDHHHSHDHQPHEHSADAFTHTHDGHTHSHLPPGVDGSPITWKSLLALGISGGLLPCPSALVVLLSAISLHRIGYGLLLVIAFSFGLAATLTGVGLMFLYAGKLLKRPANAQNHKLVKILPVLSALVITCAGAAICYEALISSSLK
jgi:ABC-type nickel/cobalt efflux system permease component RcnA